MKKIILACVATILSLSFINAQQVAEAAIEEEQTSAALRPILLGVTAGVNMTSYSGDRNSGMGLGGQIGINCDVPISQHFSIMPELIFAYKTVTLDGNRLNWDNELETGKSTDKLFYMSVPVYLKGGTELGAGRLYAAVGPVLNIGLYGKNEMKGFDNLLLFQADSNSSDIDFRQYPPYNIIDFAVGIKAGYDFNCGLAVSAAFQLGLTNMYKMGNEQKQSLNEFGLNTSQKSRTISISLGYNF